MYCMSKNYKTLEDTSYKTSQADFLYVPQFIIKKAENIVSKDFKKYYIDYVTSKCARKIINDSLNKYLNNNIISYKNKFFYEADVYSYEGNEPLFTYKLIFRILEDVMAYSNASYPKSPSNCVISVKKKIKVKKVEH